MVEVPIMGIAHISLELMLCILNNISVSKVAIKNSILPSSISRLAQLEIIF